MWKTYQRLDVFLPRRNIMVKKADAVVVGNNVISYQEGTFIWFGIDLSQDGPQTEGSKAVDKKGNRKRPNEMVGSTRSFTPVGEGSVLLHYTRPMKAAKLSKAKASAEVINEEDIRATLLAQLEAAGIDTSGANLG